MIKIPLIDANDFEVEAELDDVTYFLHFAWNDEAEIWTLSVANANNESVLSGVRIITNYPLLGNYPHLDLPKGYLIATCLDSAKPNIGRNDFVDDTVELVYISRDES
ncbi:TPA: phage baseplate plug family protein [Neisseria subflava]